MLPTPSTFEITKRSMRQYKSLVVPAGVAAARGTAYIEDPAHPGKAKLADGSLPIAGFITRDARVGGPALEDMIFTRLEGPFTSGEDASFEHAEEVEAEGEHLYSGNGGTAIAANTAIGIRCSFLDGKFVTAAAAQTAEYYLAEIKAACVPPNTFRARFVRLEGQTIPAQS